MGSFGIFVLGSISGALGGDAGGHSASAIARVMEAGGDGQAMGLEGKEILG